MTRRSWALRLGHRSGTEVVHGCRLPPACRNVATAVHLTNRQPTTQLSVLWDFSAVLLPTGYFSTPAETARGRPGRASRRTGGRPRRSGVPRRRNNLRRAPRIAGTRRAGERAATRPRGGW